jgi:hypothetical protein
VGWLNFVSVRRDVEDSGVGFGGDQVSLFLIPTPEFELHTHRLSSPTYLRVVDELPYHIVQASKQTMMSLRLVLAE